MTLVDHWVTIGHSTLPAAHLVLWKMRISLAAREFDLVTCVIRSASAAELSVSATV